MSFIRQWSKLYNLGVWRIIRNMMEKEMSIRSIAKEMGMSGNSVKKYLKNEPVKKQARKSKSKFDLFKIEKNTT